MIEKFSGNYRNETQGFTILLTETIQSIKEFDVLGLYVYLASKPNTWEPNAKELGGHTGYSKDKIYRLINRLIEIGYLSCRKIRSQGKFVSFSYTLHLQKLPLSENKEVDSPFPEKPDTVNQDAYKRKNIENKEKIYKKENFEYPETYYPQPEDNLIQEKKSKEKMKLKLPELLAANPFMLPDYLIAEWLASRKKPVTITVWSMINTELSKYCGKDSMRALEGFREMVARGWSTFKSEWMDNATRKSEFYKPKETLDMHSMIDMRRVDMTLEDVLVEQLGGL